MNYYESFILVAPDSVVTHATGRVVKGAAKSVPALEHELLSNHPYRYTQEELQFAVQLKRDGISEFEAKAQHAQRHREFSSHRRCEPGKPTCARTSYESSHEEACT